MKKEFVIERDGKSFVLYAGLLDAAHEQGLKSIYTVLVQIPSDLNGNVTICQATVETEKGTFTGIGDASPSNVTRMMAPHAIRMAETRAKARALRDAINVGMAALEELGDNGGGHEDEEEDAPTPRRYQDNAPRRNLRAVDTSDDGDPGYGEPRQVAPRPSSGGSSYSSPAGGVTASPKQIETIGRMARAAGKTITTDGLSRAQASEIISTLIGEMSERRS